MGSSCRPFLLRINGVRAQTAARPGLVLCTTFSEGAVRDDVFYFSVARIRFARSHPTPKCVEPVRTALMVTTPGRANQMGPLACRVAPLGVVAEPRDSVIAAPSSPPKAGGPCRTTIPIRVAPPARGMPSPDVRPLPRGIPPFGL